MIFKLPPQFGQCSMSMSKIRLSGQMLPEGHTPCGLLYRFRTTSSPTG